MSSPPTDPIDEESFFRKIKRHLLGVPLALEVVASYFAMLDETTPLWVKSCVASGIAYFILPVDIVPDMIPVAGIADDVAVLGATVKLVANHLLPGHYDQARGWFKS